MLTPGPRPGTRERPVWQRAEMEQAATAMPVRGGLVGAGPWAQMVHAPIIGAAPGLVLAGVWARRLEAAAGLDLGPHVVDTLDAALGPVVGVRAHGDPLRWVGLLLEHESGVVSEVDAVTAITPQTFATVAREFVSTASGTPHPLDVHRALHVQRVLDVAAADLAGTRSRPL